MKGNHKIADKVTQKRIHYKNWIMENENQKLDMVNSCSTCLVNEVGIAVNMKIRSKDVNFLQKTSKLNSNMQFPDVEIVFIYDGEAFTICFGFEDHVMIRNPLNLMGTALGLQPGCTNKDEIVEAVLKSRRFVEELYWPEVIDRYFHDFISGRY